MKLRKNFTCPLELSFDMISGKWKPIIIWRLRLGAMSLSTLNNDIVGINQKMLIQHLSELVECSIVNKKIYDGYPLRGEYYLTDLGQKFLKAIELLQEIGRIILEDKELGCNG